MIQFNHQGLTAGFAENDLLLQVEIEGTSWRWNGDYQPYLECREGKFLFRDAVKITHEVFENGIGKGIRSIFRGFQKDGVIWDYAFETLIWVSDEERLYLEWIPLEEEGLHPIKVFWPGPMEFEENRADWYTLLNRQQGLLIPNNWEKELPAIAFDGRFETAGGYMPWYGQVKEQAGYLLISETPWNCGYYAQHPQNGPFTHVGIWMEPTLGAMNERRIFHYQFRKNCDYNDLCKCYRAYVNERGILRTLKEKAARNPSIRDLEGCSFVHFGIKTKIRPDSEQYKAETPEKNESLVTFAEREQEIREIHELGVDRLYLHLDGWGDPGYDNQHPDYLPACIDAGGWEGMKSLADTVHACGYLFGIHDQYRDYYRSAPGFDEQYACRLADGSIPGHGKWAGGPQSYLCGTQAPYYVKRNFSEIRRNGIVLDGAYLDVFTCNEGDECFHPEHRMSRRDCYEYRGRCFEYLLSQGILSSSEEVSDWAVPNLVFCHYAPYDFMMEMPGTQKAGIPVPLYNLVYHDCVIEPWMMEKHETEDYMLYALLNGGAPYLIREGAYQGIDGSYSTPKAEDLKETAARCEVVAKLHRKIAECELVKHELLTADGKQQRSTFSDGTVVTVDFITQTYTIHEGGDYE